MECNSGEAVKTGVMKGGGMGILMQAHLENEIEKREIKILNVTDLDEMSVSSFVIYRKSQTLSDNAQMFLQVLKSMHRKAKNVELLGHTSRSRQYR